MKNKIALFLSLAVMLAAPAAFPCGAPFGNGINVDPKQDIIVVHKNGVETYVFQPRFCGSAQEFGLILPIPAKLATAPALSDAQAFTDLDLLSQPAVVQATVCRGPIDGGGYGNGAIGGTRDTVLVSSGTVGFMDYAQLETPSVDALTAWLDTNGYPYDALATSAFNYYVGKGWLFVAFKVNQGIPQGSTACKDLGPIALAFPTATPVVPTRMATARGRDTSGTMPYSTGFSWHVYGITEGTQQLGFPTGTGNTARVLNFSGLLADADVGHLQGLAVAGDRATKLTITFNYGSTDPDVALAIVAALDYRETVTQYVAVDCDASGKPVDPNAPPSAPGGGGCSFLAPATSSGLVLVLVAGLLTRMLRRRR